MGDVSLYAAGGDAGKPLSRKTDGDTVICHFFFPRNCRLLSVRLSSTTRVGEKEGRTGGARL